MDLSRPSGWTGELERWLAPFLAALARPEQRRWAPLYLKGLLLPGERKSVEPMAARMAPGEVQMQGLTFAGTCLEPLYAGRVLRE